MLTTAQFVILAMFVVLYALFLIWYGGRGKPLSQEEIDARLAEIQKRSGQEKEPPLLGNLRELAGQDDGRAFYMVNLIKFRKQALYPADSPFDDDPMAANARYNRAIIPRLLRYGSHPVFASRVQGRFLQPDGATEWDQVAMVRYRSRRDMLDMVVGLAGSGADLHKWAAIEETHVFPVHPVVSLIFVRGMVAVLMVGAALLLMGWLG